MDEVARRHDTTRVIAHSDKGVQYLAVRYTQRLAEAGAVASVGSTGDSYINALVETVNGYYKAALVRGPTRPGQWKSVEDLELATLGWVHWHNTKRLHGYLNDLTPAEFEQAFYAATRSDQPLVGIQ